MKDETHVEWQVSDGLTAYSTAIECMEQRVAEIPLGGREQIWLLQHPPLYTAGTNASERDLLDRHKFAVHKSGRGGMYTYHGPGQRVGYAMMDLSIRGRDIQRFINDLEEWLIKALASFNVIAERRKGRVGIWVDRGRHGGKSGQEYKIGAIGVRVRRWVSFHGVSLNVCPDLSHYEGIIPCGISAHGVTSLKDLGIEATLEDVDTALLSAFETVFQRNTIKV